MTTEEFEYINNTPVWPSRLIFNANLLYGKKLKDLTKHELFEVRKYSLRKNYKQPMESICCGARPWFDESDICGACMEHTDFEEFED